MKGAVFLWQLRYWYDRAMGPTGVCGQCGGRCADAACRGGDSLCGYLYVRLLWLTEAVRAGLCCAGPPLRVGLGT